MICSFAFPFHRRRLCALAVFPLLAAVLVRAECLHYRPPHPLIPAVPRGKKASGWTKSLLSFRRRLLSESVCVAAALLKGVHPQKGFEAKAPHSLSLSRRRKHFEPRQAQKKYYRG